MYDKNLIQLKNYDNEKIVNPTNAIVFVYSHPLKLFLLKMLCFTSSFYKCMIKFDT